MFPSAFKSRKKRIYHRDESFRKIRGSPGKFSLEAVELHWGG